MKRARHVVDITRCEVCRHVVDITRCEVCRHVVDITRCEVCRHVVDITRCEVCRHVVDITRCEVCRHVVDITRCEVCRHVVDITRCEVCRHVVDITRCEVCRHVVDITRCEVGRHVVDITRCEACRHVVDFAVNFAPQIIHEFSIFVCARGVCARVCAHARVRVCVRLLQPILIARAKHLHLGYMTICENICLEISNYTHCITSIDRTFYENLNLKNVEIYISFSDFTEASSWMTFRKKRTSKRNTFFIELFFTPFAT